MSNLPKNIPEQLGFDLFNAVREELGPGTSITESTREIGYSKSNVLVDVTPMSLVARRAINALWLTVSENPDLPHYDIDLGYFKWLAKFETSNNVGHLKKALRECQSSSVQVSVDDQDGEPQWVSVPLLGSVGIAGGRVVFKVDEMIRRQLKDPKRFTYLSVRMAAALSQYAYILYERLGTFRFKGGTDWIPVEEVRKWVNADTVKSLTEYKQFKRLVLDKNIAQINELTDLYIEYETKTSPGSRRVAAIRFKVRDNAEGKLVLDFAQPHELKDLYETLVKGFGLSKKQINELISNREVNTDERIRAAIDLVKYRVKVGGVKSPGAYLMRAIKEGWSLSEMEREAAKGNVALVVAAGEPKVPAAEIEFSRNIEKSIEDGLAIFEGLDDGTRLQVLDGLYREQTFQLAARRQKVKARPEEAAIMARKALKAELGQYVKRWSDERQAA
ncbi:replication initiation protein (plasmid) [Cupriavidus pinatubonensis]|uniref:replication initiation protein n=1 Tax=Cupriavidus pinatubonensis TaxID=248026 RepID=UPI001C73B355|nr:replication initiation protein [Cupriavidus pinatubonensis]QYY33551.1 replication initiation protein [Cupriavidus pinatubonensis]